MITTTDDTTDCDPTPGECSLRGAIELANADPESGPYTIVLAAGETYPLTLQGTPRWTLSVRRT